MGLTVLKNIVFITILGLFSCGNMGEREAGSGKLEAKSGELDIASKKIEERGKNKEIIVGANRTKEYYGLIAGKKIGIVANQTSIIIDTIVPAIDQGKVIVRPMHLVDYLNAWEMDIKKVYAPEHGFRGKADAGELLKDGVDAKTGIPILSIYGKSKKPSPEQLEGIDVMVFDIQDVGARFYTYISTLHYVMEACAEAGIPVIVLDRPNPNGHYIDGPILEKEHTSFVGMHPIPVVHGMTMGEYAKMINGEGWLKNKIKCDLTVIEMENYNHSMPYSLPIKPSPNLPNDIAINLYPSLCFFEGTIVSAGRGTDQQFQIFGAPSLPAKLYEYQFTPQANEGSKYPKFKGELCNGKDLTNHPKLNKINLDWLIEAYAANGKKKDFFIPFFTTLAGTTRLQQQIEQGLNSEEIRETWEQGIKDYDAMRKQYLIYD
ncbi:MAG: exo-beta-N-acetylmuramidase NamZ family protein [Patiriisocius sp.]|uniref:exo-beta-N-acetylmuramidase NamZ family protein n=1 Tax=Patiriisocius sp. TaxID=2822396 RepID=UPI003EF0F4D1